ncbi:MBL fold metallo-hydrolase [Mycolicibacterium brumae]|uniref:MBL fold metallo-hydrolase n=1 Tax=Mycolicibacterium brumae TaxID=85968 RepID=A0A2G5PDY1_9MYCO|nr:MBL fold metallo-hydrolase [Mycolicibacterium brumae]MCV7191898.1 MBL fold metallo-hydrolase [Mycolicibacterium brumae]PIB76233.1 MBL fold metallo-hydrolase [Mycolicibacterium brumae]RWA15723.1 hypothetical protein MBRU_09230 [Mycolicibacterium brumae DSM 44177]UWW07204.1 MBL fold metallo-hydrolase [Mycolicibacterium brumae]
MRQLYPDLWETRTDNPFPGLTTHAYLWTGGPDGNVLFYSTLTDADFDAIEELGGISHQYLSHRDEAGPTLGRIAARFGARLHAPALEAGDISEHGRIAVPLAARHVDDNGVEVIPTPGHTPGSTSYLVTGADGLRYLFTGDTIYRGEDGAWNVGLLPFSDAPTLDASLVLLATLEPDVVISSAFAGEHAALRLDTPWAELVEQARN